MSRAEFRVALVTCDAFPSLFEDDLLLGPAPDELGIRSVPAVWSDEAIDWTSFDAVVIRSTWDYFERNAEFRAWPDARIGSGVLLCNSGDILDWNYDKCYLLDLEAAGIPIVPRIHVARGDRAGVASLARDYRVQFQYGGTNENAEVGPALIDQARACVLAAPSLPVYARVDGVVQDGRFLLMELEVFEPLMFLARHPEAPGRFARAIQGRLLGHFG